MRLPIRAAVVFLALLVCSSNALFASIRIGPTAVYLSDRNKSGVISISSVATSPVDVRLDLYYGYITSDSTGSPQIFVDEKDLDNPKSCVRWISINPKRFTLLPGETRTVRFIARPPDGLADGEYWSRLVVTSEERRDLGNGGDKVISAVQQMNVRTIIPISYRRGESYADIKLLNVKIDRKPDVVHLDVDMMPVGNAAYTGNMTIVVRDAQKREIYSKKFEIAVFSTFRRRVSIPASTMSAGTYTAVISYDTDRPDMGENILHVLPKTYTVEFVLR